MRRLRTFGGLALTDPAGLPGGAGPAPQRSRLAFLAALASAGERGVPREKLMTLFWPESDPERAKNALNQAVFVVRKELGDSVLLGTGGVLALNPAAIESDIGDFYAALKSKDWETAVRLHTGPFLDGVYVREGKEFEHWLDAERQRIFAGYRDALTLLATRADAQGDLERAVNWWKLVSTADPLSSRAACGYMMALSASGDITTALSFVRVHENLVRQELDLPVAREVADLATQLRADIDRVRPSGPSLSRATPATAQDEYHRQMRRSLDGAEEQRLAGLRTALAGRFTLERSIESTSAWTSILARERGGDPCIVHMLRPALVDLIAVDAFIAELQRASAVRDPDILPILSVGAAGNVVYFICPTFDGRSLRDRLQGEPQLSIRDAISITLGLAGALAAAHATNVLHLNVKPRNVIVAGGRTLLRDIGVVPALTVALGTDAARSGFISLGTPGYMSPEQITGTISSDGRSDIYSLGCVFYHMLAGEPPFGNVPSLGSLSRRVVEAPPRVRRDGLPAQVEEVLMMMLARVPADRFQSASLLQASLAEAAAER